MLSKVGLQNETLNLGGASFGSDHVKALSQEVKSLHPSAILIYSGNNEYFNFGLALSQKNPNYQSGPIYLQSLHLFRLFNVLLGKGPVKLNIALEQLTFEQDKRLAELIQGILTNEPDPSFGTMAWPSVRFHHPNRYYDTWTTSNPSSVTTQTKQSSLEKSLQISLNRLGSVSTTPAHQSPNERPFRSASNP